MRDNPVRLLYASERPPYPFFLGGAARAAHMLLVRIAAQPDVMCAAVGSRDYAVSTWHYPDNSEAIALGVRSMDRANATLDCGYPIRLLADFDRTLANEIAAFRPSLVWSQLEGSLKVLQVANRLGVAGLCYIHDAEFDLEEMRQIAALDCHLVASSNFLADKIYRATGHRAAVVYPPAELYFDTPGDPGGVVTMINPHPVKGLKTFLDIAQRRPGINFLLQESWKLDEPTLAALRQSLAELPNVRLAARVSDMRSVYRQTRLLIAPSRWEEGFGMVALEAQSCGIPVIASRRGGLPEAVGDGGLLVDDYMNVDAWLSTLDAVLNDAARYDALAERARNHAASAIFAPDQLAQRLLAIAKTKPTRPDWLARCVFTVSRHVRTWPLIGKLLRA